MKRTSVKMAQKKPSYIIAKAGLSEGQLDRRRSSCFAQAVHVEEQWTLHSESDLCAWVPGEDYTRAMVDCAPVSPDHQAVAGRCC